MAVVYDDQPVVVTVITPEENAREIQVELDELGITYEELVAEAETEDFSTEQARRLWFMIRPLG